MHSGCAVICFGLVLLAGCAPAPRSNSHVISPAVLNTTRTGSRGERLQQQAIPPTAHQTLPLKPPKPEPGLLCVIHLPKTDGYGLRFLPDGRQLETRSPQGKFQYWSLPTGRLLRTLVSHVPVSSNTYVTYSPNRRLAATQGDSVKVGIYTVASGRRLHLLPTNPFTNFPIPEGPKSGVVFSPDGNTLAVSTTHHEHEVENAVVEIWSTKTGRKERTLPGLDVDRSDNYGTEIEQMGFSPDGKIFVTIQSHLWGAEPGEVRDLVKFWDTRSWHVKRKLPRITGNILIFAFVRQSRFDLITEDFTFTRDANYHVLSWELRSARKLSEYTGEYSGDRQPDLAVSLSPTGKTYAICSYYFEAHSPIHIVDFVHNRILKSIPVTVSGVNILLSPNGSLLAVEEGGEVVKIWRVPASG